MISFFGMIIVFIDKKIGLPILSRIFLKNRFRFLMNKKCVRTGFGRVWLSICLALATGLSSAWADETVVIAEGEERHDAGNVYSDGKTVVYAEPGAIYTADNVTVTNGWLIASYAKQFSISNSTLATDGGNAISASGITDQFVVADTDITMTHNSAAAIAVDFAMWGTDAIAVISGSTITIRDNPEAEYEGRFSAIKAGSEGAAPLMVTDTQIWSLATNVGGASALYAYNGGAIDGLRVNIEMARTNSGAETGVLYARDGARISLTDSTIKSADGNVLITSDGYAGGEAVVLNHVDLSEALNQKIMLSPTGTSYSVVLQDGTHFHGSVEAIDGGSDEGSVDLSLENASWTVSADSLLNGGTLSLDALASLYFVTDTGTLDFFDLSAASVILAGGSSLILDQDATAYQAGDRLSLFSSSDVVNDGCLIISRDGFILEYDPEASVDGSFELTGNFIPVPEPATVTFGLVSMAVLFLRRKRRR